MVSYVTIYIQSITLTKFSNATQRVVDSIMRAFLPVVLHVHGPAEKCECVVVGHVVYW